MAAASAYHASAVCLLLRAGQRKARERGHVSISRGWLDGHVTEQVISAIDTEKLVARLRKRKRAKGGLPSEIEARLELLEVDHYERGLIGRESYLRRRENLLRQLKAARDVREDRGIDLPLDLARNLGERWELLTIHEQRRIMSAVIDRVMVARAANHGKIDPSRVQSVWR